MRRLTAGVTALAAATLVLSGCSGPSTDFGTGDGFSIEAGLRQIPAAGYDAQGSLITIADINATMEAAGLDPANDDWLELTYPKPDASAGYIPAPSLFARTAWLQTKAEMREAFGWALDDITAFAEIVRAPDGTFTVFGGDFDQDTLPDTLTPVREGIVSDGDGDDLEVNLNADGPRLDALGRSVRMAHSDGRLGLAFTTDLVAQWLAGPEESLADIEELRVVAEQLDANGALAAIIRPDRAGSAARSFVPPDVLAQIEETLISEPFDTVGLGWTVVDGSTQSVVVYQFASDESASAARDSVEALWLEGRGLTGIAYTEHFSDTEVTQAGSTVVVTTTPDVAGRLYNLLVNEDLVFLSR